MEQLEVAKVIPAVARAKTMVMSDKEINNASMSGVTMWLLIARDDSCYKVSFSRGAF